MLIEDLCDKGRRLSQRLRVRTEAIACGARVSSAFDVVNAYHRHIAGCRKCTLAYLVAHERKAPPAGKQDEALQEEPA